MSVNNVAPTGQASVFLDKSHTSASSKREANESFGDKAREDPAQQAQESETTSKPTASRLDIYI